MGFPTLLNWNSLFPFSGLFGGIFHFCSNSNMTYILCANSEDPNQMPHSEASDLGLHFLPMFHKKDAKHNL